ncbi:hypothetical protein G6F24_012020 [Rhizopus arrhizus]|nr:hypothetical protein G6F24_012020 [Rhizopus arrhizus]
MDTIREVSLMIKPNDYLVSIDLSDAFLHIGLHQDSRRYLRFKWRDQVYQYRTTAFGLASSPYVFTKVCRPILHYFRSQGYRISAYLDDWILAANSKQLAIQQAQAVLALLQQLGWIVNYKKSVLTPTQQLEHLGFLLNTRTMMASLPLKKLRDIRRSIKQILDKPSRQTPRTVHSLTMRIQAATFAIFPARLYTRHLLYFKNQVVKSDTDWDRLRPLDQASKEELRWWYDNLKKWNGRSLLPSTPTQTIYVDASNTGWGCSLGKQRAHGYWAPEEAAQSINWRELKADRQHNQPVVYQQTGGNTVAPFNESRNGSLELVSSTQHYDSSSTHQRDLQQNSRYGVSPNILQEPMANNSNSIPTDSTTMGSVLDRPLCRQDNQVVTKLRVLASGSGRYPYGCLHSTMDELDEAFRKSPMESDISGSEQDTSREASSSGNGGTVLAECSMVSSVTTDGSFTPSNANTSNSSNNMSQNTSPSTTQELDAIRVAIIRNKLESQHLNKHAVSDLLRQRLAPTATNKGYRKNQLRFLEWAQQHKVSFTAFSGVDLVNFLADIRQSHGLQVATLKTTFFFL